MLHPAAPRLACVKPVASVHPEPGSNSPLLYLSFLFFISKKTNTQLKKFCLAFAVRAFRHRGAGFRITILDLSTCRIQNLTKSFIISNDSCTTSCLLQLFQCPIGVLFAESSAKLRQLFHSRKFFKNFFSPGPRACRCRRVVSQKRVQR